MSRNLIDEYDMEGERLTSRSEVPYKHQTLVRPQKHIYPVNKRLMEESASAIKIEVFTYSWIPTSERLRRS
jgi:hypothetical protein